MLRRTLLAVLVTSVAAVALGAAPAGAATNCGRQVIDDWFKDGRVDKVYPLHCYDDALEQLPNDVRTYSDAPQAIKRALQQALAKGAPVEGNGTPGGGTTTTPTETTPSDEGDDPATTTTSEPTTPTDGSGGPGDGQALGSETSDAGSVPLPLIVLGGLALLLLAAGGAGYLNRRLQARRIDGGPGEPPADV